MSLVFEPTVNDVSTIEGELKELSEKLVLIKELEQCPNLMLHFSKQADAIAIDMARMQWTGDANKLQEWALRRVAELGVYKHFYQLVGSKAAILEKYAQINTQLNSQE